MTHTHAQNKTAWGTSNTVAIINNSISGLQIKSLSEMPVLCIFSTKWHSLLLVLIAHLVIRAIHFRTFLVGSFSTLRYIHNTVEKSVPAHTHTSTSHHPAPIQGQLHRTARAFGATSVKQMPDQGLICTTMLLHMQRSLDFHIKQFYLWNFLIDSSR